MAAISNDEPEAQAVSTYLSTIREHLLRDRALHDMVRLPSCFDSFLHIPFNFECRQPRPLSLSFGLIVNMKPLTYSD